MDIVVVGAGIGGLALSHGLLAAGHQVSVLERQPQPSTGGAAVTIFSNGAAALAGLGVRIDDLGARITDLHIRDARGRDLMRTDFTALTARSRFEVRTVPRAALVQRLTANLPVGVVNYATAVERVDADPRRPVVYDAAGTSRSANIIVGSDGYRSVVRREVLGSAPARDVGWATWQGLSPVLSEVATSNTGLLLVGDAGVVGMMPAGTGLVQWWFDVRWSPDNPPTTTSVAWLRGQFANYADPVGRLLESIADRDLGLYPHVVHDVADQWGRGAVTLLGDAAHAFPPSQAQGANQALEDAWLLANLLKRRGNDDAASVLRAYEAQRAAPVRRVSRLAASERTNRPPSPVLATLARLTPTRISSRAYARLIYRFSTILSQPDIYAPTATPAGPAPHRRPRSSGPTRWPPESRSGSRS